MINYFYETVLAGGIVSILIVIVYILTPLLDRRYLNTWRLGIWKVCITFLILPIGAVVGFLPLLWGNGLLNSRMAVPIEAPQSDFGSSSNNLVGTSFTQHSSDITTLIFIIWFSGICILAIYYALQYFRFIRKLNSHCTLLPDDIMQAVKIENLPEKLNKKPLKLYQNSYILTPMIVGFINPRIIIPQRDYDKETLSIIIEHETAHFLRKDLWWKLFCIFTKILHWYNPLIYIMARSVDQDIELCCDLQVLKNKEATFHHAYSDVILKEIVEATQQRNAIFAGMGHTEKSMKKRLKNLFTIKAKKGGICIALSLFILFTMNIVAFSASNPPSPATNTEFEAQIQHLIQQKEKADREKREDQSIESYYVPDYQEVINNHTNEDGNVDTEAVHAAFGIPFPSDSKFNIKEKEISYAVSDAGYVDLHILTNGDIGAYYNVKGEYWELKKGDRIILNLWADSRYYENNSGLIFGYVKDGEYSDVETLKSADLIAEKRELSLNIPEDGTYYFYLLCTGDGMVIKGLSFR